MSKFKIKVKLTGFELEIEGDRQDIPALTRSVSKQLGGMIAPPSADLFEDAEIVPDTPAALPEAKKPAKKKRPSAAKSATSISKSEVAHAIELNKRSVESKYGTPKQQWSSGDKLLWLLYVADKEAGLQGLSSGQLKETFNKHYRTNGAVTAQNTADLRKKVISNPALLGKDTSKEPVTWYLTEAGLRHVEALIASPGKE